MTLDEWAAARAGRGRLGMVIFDCDGVLIDSEALCNRVVARELTDLGWPITTEEAQAQFLGLSFHDMTPAIEARIGRSLDAGWVDRLVTRVVAAMAAEAEPVPDAVDTLHAVSALGLPWRVASNSSHEEMRAKFHRTGLTGLMAGRLHSADDVIARGGRGKPAPDVYLDAAAAQGIDPAACVVIEDSVAGARAAIAAGMDCLGFSPDHDGAHLRAVGAVPFHAMRVLPSVLRRLVGSGA